MSVRAELRALTADIHEALHDAAPFGRIARGDMDRIGYGRLLRMLHAYHREMAQACGRAAAALRAPELDRAHGARIAALEEDLSHLGLTGGCLPGPAPEMAADFAIGCLYTVQGSTLGGKVIHRQLDPLLPDDSGRRFFKGDAGDGRRWQMLCALLEGHGGDRAAHAAGARHAFARFRDLLDADDRTEGPAAGPLALAQPVRL